jgi:hypothetical protein
MAIRRLAKRLETDKALARAKNYETKGSEGPNVVAVRPVRIRFLN